MPTIAPTGAAARVGDLTNHPGKIEALGIHTVDIGGLPAAMQGDNHICAIPSPPGPHPPAPIIEGSRTVFIDRRPAARVGDKTGCGAAIVTGLANVIIGG